MATSTIAGIGEVERRTLIGNGVRAAFSTGVLILAYYLVPVSVRHPGSHGILYDIGAMLRLGVAFAVFLVVLTLEIRAITRSKHPMLRAGVAMAVVIPLFLLFFAWTYLTMSASNPATFGRTLDRTTALYFTVTVFSTVGFGDITARTDLARILVMFQMLADLAVIAVVVRLILGAATRSRDGAATDQTSGQTVDASTIDTSDGE